MTRHTRCKIKEKGTRDYYRINTYTTETSSEMFFDLLRKGEDKELLNSQADLVAAMIYHANSIGIDALVKSAKSEIKKSERA